MAELGQHGGNVLETAIKLGIDEKTLTDFSANINPLGMPARLKAAPGRTADAGGALSRPAVPPFAPAARPASRLPRVLDPGGQRGNGTHF